MNMHIDGLLNIKRNRMINTIFNFCKHEKDKLMMHKSVIVPVPVHFLPVPIK